MEKNLGSTYTIFNPMSDPLPVVEAHIKRLGKGEPDPQACNECEQKWMARLGLSQDDELAIEEAILEHGPAQFNPACPRCQAEFEELVARINEHKARVTEIVRLRQEANGAGLTWCGLVGKAC